MLLVVKFRNQIHRLNPALQVDMKNIRVNGAARGCYGYITDPATGLVIAAYGRTMKVASLLA